MSKNEELLFDKPNVSYKGKHNISSHITTKQSIECQNYRKFVSSNLGTFECPNLLTSKVLDSKKVSVTIKDNQITFQVKFEETEQHIFNSILDRADIEIDQLLEIAIRAKKFFSYAEDEEYNISHKTGKQIDTQIAQINKYVKTWKNLTNKPDYNLTTFKVRMLPYFALESKEWLLSSLTALQQDYPLELAENKTKKQNGGQEETIQTFKNNNFLEWTVLPVEKYHNMSALVSRIKNIYDLGLKYQAITMFCRLLLSPKDCHICKEPNIWKLFESDMQNPDINELVRYCMFYAMYILRQEETVMFSNVNSKSRVLFTLEQAAGLPTFDNAHIERNPYIIQLTDDTDISRTMPFYIQGKRRINDKSKFMRRFHMATAGAFKDIDFKELNAAITGSILIPCVHTSPLEELFCKSAKWDRSRSVECKFPYMTDNPTSPEDEEFLNYLSYYYPGYSDLTDQDYKSNVLKPSEFSFNKDDIIYDDDVVIIPANFGGTRKINVETQSERDANEINTDVPDNLEHTDIPDNLESKSDVDKVDVIESKSDVDNSDQSEEEENSNAKRMSRKKKAKSKKYSAKKSKKSTSTKLNKKIKNLSLDDTEVEKPLDDTEVEKPLDDTEVEKPLDDTEDSEVKKPEVKEQETKELETKTISTKPAIQYGKVEYNQLADIDISITTKDVDVFKQRVKILYDKIVANCAHRGPVYITEVKTARSVKYKVHGPGISRPMDIFNIPYDPIKMVKKFHVNPVKMYYDGDVTLYRSCVTSLLSGVGENYKWFSCNKIPADVILKYAQRGITIIFNRKERDAISKFLPSCPRWNLLLESNDINPKKIYCVVGNKHAFFRPGLSKSGIRMGLRDFELETPVYNDRLVVEEPTQVFEYGEMLTHDNKKIYPPNHNLITDAINYIQYIAGSTEADSDENNLSDNEPDE